MRILLTTVWLLVTVSLYAQEIAITFDDAPTPETTLFTGNERTKRIIQQLKDEKVAQVAFFVTTININNETRNRLLQYIEAGHVLANHSHTHQWIHQIGTAGYITDLKKAHEILKAFPSYKPWFRYPFLDEGKTKTARDSIRTALSSISLTNGYVTIDNYDWYINALLRKAIQEKKKINEDNLRKFYIDHVYSSIEFYDNIAKKTLGRSPKHVLLLHETDISAKFIGDLVRHLRSKGWKIISPEEAYTDPIATQIPDVLFNGQGRVAAIARERGTLPKELVQESEDEEFLDRLAAEKKIFE